MTLANRNGWKWTSGWLESWEGLLLPTDISTTCAEAIFRVYSISFLHRSSKRQSPTTVLLRSQATQIITFKKGMSQSWIQTIFLIILPIHPKDDHVGSVLFACRWTPGQCLFMMATPPNYNLWRNKVRGKKKILLGYCHNFK